jgi:2-polyprenyl-6-methoxyphenol hydroxylase-like FAD-dependent oxidoreductase
MRRTTHYGEWRRIQIVETLSAQCCITGGGPAGMMLGYLLARAGVKTVVTEKHADFLRDFRGDTVHPSTMQIMKELGLLDEFLKLPHSTIHSFEADIGHQRFKIADFTHVPITCRFIALMPQWDFLKFLSEKSRRFPSLSILMSTEVESLIEANGRVMGVHATGPSGPLEINADLVVGCDGRSSTVRKAAGLGVHDLGSPIDVLWFRLSKQPGDPERVLGHLGVNKMVVTIDRTDYWQCAFVIAKGRIDQVHRAGIEAFRTDVAAGAPFLANRVAELESFDAVKLLSVSIDRLTTWSKPGLLCIGDAAHAMSPIGGVGINLAIQDAVATANLLARKLKDGTCRDEDLDAVRQRRLWPVKVIQWAQVAVHNAVLKPTVMSTRTSVSAPWPVKLLDRYTWLRRWPAQVIGVGVRPEHVQSPEV